ncbi:MAG: hypothetical protein WCV50_01955 [Patescibacteria group bacterium]|jgi:hypothetical protein
MPKKIPKYNKKAKEKGNLDNSSTVENTPEELKNEIAQTKKITVEDDDVIREDSDIGLPVNKSKLSFDDFNSIYKSKKGESVDMSRIERRDPNRKKKLVAWITAGLIVLLAVTVAGFYFFVHHEKKFEGDNITMSLDAPGIISSGTDVGLTLEVSNNEQIDILKAEVTMQFPSGFTFSSSSPVALNEANNAWDLGDIKSGQSKKVLITGRVNGDIGSGLMATAVLNYVPANFNSDFQKRETFTLNISDSAVSLNFEVPPKAISGSSADYKIIVKNSSADAMKKMQLALTLPEGFEADNFSPQPTSEKDMIWDIDSLDGGQEYSLTWKGVVTGNEGEMRELKAKAGYTDDQGQYHEQAEEDTIIFIFNPQLILGLSIHDSLTDGTVSFGEKLDYVITFQNKSQSEFNNLTLQMNIVSPLIDWPSLADAYSGSLGENTITWDSSQWSALKKIKPGDEGVLRFSVALKDNILTPNDNDKNYAIFSQAKASSTEVVDLEGGLKVDSNQISTKVNSRLDLKAEGRYYNDGYIAVGSGPLPPEVGEKTTYQIYWFLQNNVNEVTDAQASAVLPEGVDWADDSSVSAGSINYNAETRTVTWSINKIPIHVGQQIPELEARFAVSIIPTADDLGNILVLLDKSTATARDTFTAQNLSVTQDIITSELPNDPLGTGKGIVVGTGATNSNSNSNTNTSTNINSATNKNSNSNTNTAH